MEMIIKTQRDGFSKLKSAMSHCTETATGHEAEVLASVFIIVIIIMHVLL